MSRRDRWLSALAEFNSSEYLITKLPAHVRVAALMDPHSSLADAISFYEKKLAFSRTTLLEVEAKSCDTVVDLKDKAIKAINNCSIVGLYCFAAVENGIQ